MKTLGFITGSFDPFTIGHLNLVKRSMDFVDKVVILVAKNPDKNGMFTNEERVNIIISSIQTTDRVWVVNIADEDKLVADAVKDITAAISNETREQYAPVLIRGCRSCKDFEYEYEMATTNEKEFGVKTIILPAVPELANVSSTLVRTLIKYNKPFEHLVAYKNN